MKKHKPQQFEITIGGKYMRVGCLRKLLETFQDDLEVKIEVPGSILNIVDVKQDMFFTPDRKANYLENVTLVSSAV